ncbi:MAG TPA: hypothetical protein VE934_11550 [Polaromonas sp.]|uniref:hypothetical protein n=1 Tax=Polaromonas sp. TaxID=1869339 RepID=UPI002D3DEBB8|nr:hypothetical protein [Polaromonas sp.]HYW57589.1 hypothetical protein [Polaromonas sp.]
MAEKTPAPQPAKEEPEIGSEPDIPSDGPDVEGEKMIRKLEPAVPLDKPEK